jgi:hypothetical protein
MAGRSCHAAFALVLALWAATALEAQDAGFEEQAALAVAEAALEAISAGDPAALADLMIEGAVLVSTRARDDRPSHSLRTREEERARSGTSSRIVERGFRGEARVAGGVATVWLPYDLYIDGSWSHCGVDVFTLVHTEAGWRIATLAWSIEQPPACDRHPAGPPGGL